ncbi:MAG: type II toxin-antitoxin system RelE/ParE family toxin [Treponema succinifaciens]|uniref:type II toxin-antitoxin system RelE family toxin n=1 Tax=Treponema succinifaciens TaxID=167 RepID=UPI0023527BF9|nr:type II toxin-antitoxin system RelE/ParE family toxin [Treponema succinifaciens]MCI6912785.1 type II toxin-antitoxin system RelE/ParE family toxin [Treponema succinifaciens]MDY2615128.1 type II toxin-antitoxin system RelE/ParE family toxin [Treponema succinifaciens]UKI54792.1 MAG: type II toxin-antitoxin system RelE/ParE family toxin [Treponema succinifaciens]
MNIEFSPLAEKQFLKLDKQIQRQIQKFVLQLKNLENPRSRGKALVGNLSHLWRYRVADYRLICDIQDEKILVTILRIGHRKEIYKN